MAHWNAGRPLTAICLALVATAAIQAQEPAVVSTLDRASIEEKQAFLQTARVVKSKELGKGVTRPLRVTLTDGSGTHDAVFQAVDQTSWTQQFADGTREFRFRDYWGYNIAAFELSRLLGWEEFVPVAVERRLRGKAGALVWWVDSKYDEASRVKANARPPDPVAWNRHIQRLRLLTELTADSDRNQGNLLITADWRLVAIDFTRAFRLRKELKWPDGLNQCEHETLGRLKALDKPSLERAAGRWLTGEEIASLLMRRDLLVRHFERLIAARGEQAVLIR